MNRKWAGRTYTVLPASYYSPANNHQKHTKNTTVCVSSDEGYCNTNICMLSYFKATKGVLNMIDTTLLDKEGPVTLEDLRAYFYAHDFSAMSSGYDKEHESNIRNSRFKRIVKCFKKAWRDQMKEMTGKTMSNYTSSSTIGCMELSESELVAGTLVDIMEDEAQLDQLLEIGLTVLRQPLEEELEKLAQGKPMEKLTEEEFIAALAPLADLFLNKMMRILLEVQEADKWMDFTKEMSAQEDFNTQLKENHDNIDFRRQWYHLRTKIGAMLSLSEVGEDVITDMDRILAARDPKRRIQDDEKYDLLLQAFCKSLNNDIDSQIVYMCDEGLTQKEMAQRLGYANHSAVSKRIKKIYQKCCAFLEALPKEDETEEE